jgi:hypothetical protein
VKPGLAHALLGLAIWLVVTLGALPFGADAAMWCGVTATAWFYIGRERRQSEEHFGSNRIPPWCWRERALRDVAWPVGAALIATLAVLAFDRLGGALLFAAVLG